MVAKYFAANKYGAYLALVSEGLYCLEMIIFVFLSLVLGAIVTQVEIVKVYVQKVDSDPFQNTILDLHNEKRELHHSQPLHWNSTLYEYAADYASSYDCSGHLVHSGGPYGENLAAGYTTNGSINAWYNEGKTHAYGAESAYNHFTAMVWNNTNSVGCAYKECNNAWGTYIICSYYPPGNVVGYSKYNVFPPL